MSGLHCSGWMHPRKLTAEAVHHITPTHSKTLVQPSKPYSAQSPILDLRCRQQGVASHVRSKPQPKNAPRPASRVVPFRSILTGIIDRSQPITELGCRNPSLSWVVFFFYGGLTIAAGLLALHNQHSRAAILHLAGSGAILCS